MRAAAQARAPGRTTEPRLTRIVTRAPNGSHQVYIIPSTNIQLQGTSPLVYPSGQARQSRPTGPSYAVNISSEDLYRNFISTHQ